MNEVEKPSAINVVAITQTLGNLAQFCATSAQGVVETRLLVDVEQSEQRNHALNGCELEQPPNHHLYRHQSAAKPSEQGGYQYHSKREPRINAIGLRQLWLGSERIVDFCLRWRLLANFEHRCQPLCHNGVVGHKGFNLLSDGALFPSLFCLVHLYHHAIIVVGLVIFFCLLFSVGGNDFALTQFAGVTANGAPLPYEEKQYDGWKHQVDHAIRNKHDAEKNNHQTKHQHWHIHAEAVPHLIVAQAKQQREGDGYQQHGIIHQQVRCHDEEIVVKAAAQQHDGDHKQQCRHSKHHSGLDFVHFCKTHRTHLIGAEVNPLQPLQNIIEQLGEQKAQNKRQHKIKDHKDSTITMLRAYALAREGKMGERLFEYRVYGGSEALLPNGTTVKSLLLPKYEIFRFVAKPAVEKMGVTKYLK